MGLALGWTAGTASADVPRAVQVRVSDPEGLAGGLVRIEYPAPSGETAVAQLNDDGMSPDSVPGDGLHAGEILGIVGNEFRFHIVGASSDWWVEGAFQRDLPAWQVAVELGPDGNVSPWEPPMGGTPPPPPGPEEDVEAAPPRLPEPEREFSRRVLLQLFDPLDQLPASTSVLVEAASGWKAEFQVNDLGAPPDVLGGDGVATALLEIRAAPPLTLVLARREQRWNGVIDSVPDSVQEALSLRVTGVGSLYRIAEGALITVETIERDATGGGFLFRASDGTRAIVRPKPAWDPRNTALALLIWCSVAGGLAVLVGVVPRYLSVPRRWRCR